MYYKQKVEAVDEAVSYLVKRKKTDITHYANIMSVKEFEKFCDSIIQAARKKIKCRNIVIDRDEFIIYLCVV